MEDKIVKAEEKRPAAAPAAGEVGKCPNCGGKMKKDENGEYVCPYCDTRVADERTREKNVPAEKRRGKAYFTASRIAKIAMLAALAYVVTFFEFPIFPATPYLQLDFSNVFVLLGGFMYGPLAAILISGVKELLSLLDTSTGGVGEIANFLLTFIFVILPTLVYRFKKGLPTVIATLAAGIVLLVAAGLLVNRYINFPLYMQGSAASVFQAVWWYIVLFNLIKGVAVSLITILLYKRISRLFDKF